MLHDVEQLLLKGVSLAEEQDYVLRVKAILLTAVILVRSDPLNMLLKTDTH